MIIPKNISASCPTQTMLDYPQKNIKSILQQKNQEVANNSDIIILAIKPY